ncbi:hypothetical protein ACFU9Y_10690 [Streptomyces sp. NPDC057621]|uniref:hypothetical protein n=1 Tax=Streptomyces sp. NPDC057621 TaxID=3346186 RepID=UPI003690E40E
MTAITRRQLSLVPVRVRRGATHSDKPIRLRHTADGACVVYDPDWAGLDAATMLTRMRLRMEGFTLGEILLEDHEPQLTALYLACSRLQLDVEHTTGPRTTEPVVVCHEGDWSYMVPEQWDTADALERLPAAFTAARPGIACELERLKEAKRTTQGSIDQALDLTASLLLQTGDAAGVYAELLRLLGPSDPPLDQATGT